MKLIDIVIILLLIPVGFYLRELAYSSYRRPFKLFEDIESLYQSFKRWRERNKKREK